MLKTLLSCLLVVLSVSAAEVKTFNAGEFAVSARTSYAVDTSAAFQQPYTLNVAAGVSYFATRALGIEAWVPLYSTKGASVQEVQAGLLVRLPLASDTQSVWSHFAPYIGAGGVYNWTTTEAWAYIGKAGLEWRPNAKWGIFVEGQYRNVDFDSLADGQVNLAGGLKLVF